MALGKKQICDALAILFTKADVILAKHLQIFTVSLKVSFLSKT